MPNSTDANRGLVQSDAASIAGIEKLRCGPFAIQAGEGNHLISEDGRRILDFSASWGAAKAGEGEVIAELDFAQIDARKRLMDARSLQPPRTAQPAHRSDPRITRP